MKKLLLIAGLANVLSAGLQAQDFTFSQFSLLRPTSNPATIGNFSQDASVNAGIRNQWYAANTPYQVAQFAAELNIVKVPKALQKIGVMLAGVNDQLGQGSIVTNQAMLGVSGYKTLDASRRKVLSFGLAGTYQVRQIDASNFVFGRQFDPAIFGFNSSISSGEVLSKGRLSVLQVALGVNYRFQMAENSKFYVGGSVIDINEVKDASINTAVNTVKQKRRFTADIGFEKPISSSMSVEPQAFFNYQGSAYELNAGLWMNLQVSNSFRVSPGLFYRYNDAFIPAIKLGNQNWWMALSYDATTTGVKEVNLDKKFMGLGGFGAFEFSFGHRFRYRGGAGKSVIIPCRTI
jgi:type IX secretion system PorP/SprF family membrane protein